MLRWEEWQRGGNFSPPLLYVISHIGEAELALRRTYAYKNVEMDME